MAGVILNKGPSYVRFQRYLENEIRQAKERNQMVTQKGNKLAMIQTSGCILVLESVMENFLKMRNENDAF